MELKESIRLRKVVKWKYKVAKNVSSRIIFSALRPFNILRTPLAPFQQPQLITYHVHIMSIWADIHVWLPLVNLTLLPNTQQSVERMSVAVEEKQTSRCGDLIATADIEKEKKKNMTRFLFQLSLTFSWARPAAWHHSAFCTEDRLTVLKSS